MLPGYALAIVVGLVLGLLGGGGAILTIPVLHHVMGYSVREAVPMSLVVVGITSILGAVFHRQQGHVRLRTAFGFGVPAILGAVLGADLGPRVRDGARLTVFAVVLLIAAVLMFRGRGGSPDSGSGPEPPPRRPQPFITMVGGAVGFLTGFIGVGGGFAYVPALTVLGGLPIRDAIGTSLVLITLSCAAGLARYLGNPTLGLDWPVTALFTGLALVGAGIGSRLVPFVSQARLRRGFAAFLVVLGLVVLLVRR